LQTQFSILPSSNSDVVGDIYQDITKEVKTQAKLEIIADLPSLPLVDSDSLQVSRSECIYEPPLCSQLLSLKDIDLAIVPFVAKSNPYSEKETQVFSYLLHRQNEKKHIKPNNCTKDDWKKFATRWKYHCQVENCLGNSNFLTRDQFQLKQKKKERHI